MKSASVLVLSGLIAVAPLSGAEPAAARLSPVGLSPAGFELTAQLSTGATHEVQFTEDFDTWRLLAVANI